MAVETGLRGNGVYEIVDRTYEVVDRTVGC